MLGAAGVKSLTGGERMQLNREAGAPAGEALDSPEALARREALALPGELARGMFFQATLEAVRALGDEEAVRRCLEASGEERFVDFFNYPVATHLRVLFTAAQQLQGRCGSLEEALRQLGLRAGVHFMRCVAGMALLLVSRWEPRRLVDGLPSVYRAAVSYGKRSVMWTGPASGRLLMQREFMPYPFQEGVLAGVLEGGKARGVQVRGRQLSTLDSEYDVSWRE